MRLCSSSHSHYRLGPWFAWAIIFVAAGCGDDDASADAAPDSAIMDAGRDSGSVDTGLDVGPICPNLCDEACMPGEQESVDCNGRCDASDSADGPDCNGLCAAGEDGPDCDAICELGDEPEGADCDGICEGTDEAGSPDCDGMCTPLDSMESPDCNAMCDAADPSDGHDCNAICDEGDAPDGPDCDAQCGLEDAAAGPDCDAECDFAGALLPYELGSVDCAGFMVVAGTTLGEAVKLGDIDGDGDIDLVGPFSVYLNDGNAVFTMRSAGLQSSRNIALGDLDGDGDLDLFNDRSTGDGSNQVWLNDGTGAFALASEEFGSGRGGWVSLGDLDGDGDLDAFVSNDNGDAGGVAAQSATWINDGAATFALGQLLPASITQRNRLMDFDGDGDLDVFETFMDSRTDLNGRGIRVWSNDGSGVLSLASALITSMPGSVNYQGIAVGDIDADGSVEVLAGLTTGTASWRYVDAAFVPTTEYGPTPGRFHGLGLALGDLNGDGWLDLLSTDSGLNLSSGQFHVAFGNAAGELEVIQQHEALVNGALDMHLADLDGDGDLDAVTIGVRGRDNTILINNPRPPHAE